MSRSGHRVARVAAALLAFSGCSAALAQNVAPFGFTAVVENGVQIYVNLGGGDLWRGVDADRVDVANFGRWLTGLASWQDPNSRFIPRHKVRYLCPEHCRRDVFFGETPRQDSVFWKDGTKTTGRIEVRCGDYNRCFIFQDGVSSHKPNEWEAVDYLFVAPPKP